MKKCKGITLMSLIIYMTVLFVVLAVTIRIMTYFRNNINDAVDVTFETEFEKLNMYMIEETNKKGNSVVNYSENAIVFSDGKTFVYEYSNEEKIGVIYYSGIKLCENIKACNFSYVEDEETSKKTITVNITINGIQKETTYVMAELDTSAQTLDEDNYITN